MGGGQDIGRESLVEGVWQIATAGQTREVGLEGEEDLGINY